MPPAPPRIANRGLLTASSMIAVLMQVLDSTIANVALPYMQGSLNATLDQISLQHLTFPAALQSGQITVTGKVEKFAELLGMLEPFPGMFPIIEPRPAR